MKKKLDTTAIMNELKGASPFFPAKQEAVQEEPVITPTEQSEQIREVVSRYHDTVIPSNHDTTIPEDEEDILEAVRRSVKQVGKEPATQRLTLVEKQNLKDIEYSYSRQGIKTNGN